MEAFNIEMDSREDLYRVFVEFSKTDAGKSLQGEDKRYLEKVINGFERNGLGLEPAARKRISEIKQKLSELSIRFSQNLNEDKTELEFTKEELDGVSSDYLQDRKMNGDRYVITLKYPDLFPILEECRIAETRKKMEFANSAKCAEKNSPLLEEAISLRQEEAQLLGFKNHAAYILDIRMAKTTQRVFDFLNDLVEKLEKPARKDIEKLLKLKESETKESDGKLNIWDWRYFDNLMLQKEFQVDHNLIKDYFPLEKVTKGMLDIYQEILGLKFVQLESEKSHVWHEDVQQFEVLDVKSGNFIGHFYLDLFPRDGKYGHAAEFDLVKGCTIRGKKQNPASAMVANFTKPLADKPSLLKFSEVETYFHEFGHVMHEICATAKHYRFSGTNVERDFVEAPSQMLENWCYEEEVLKIISGHYQDQSKTLPNELREKIIKARNVNEALKNRRQLHFGMFDMLLHTAEGRVDSQKMWLDCMSRVGMIPGQEGTNGAATFGHIMGGYSAGYYGYLWSKVYSCDMFLKFKNSGVMNSEIGRKYRDIILAAGGTRDAWDCVCDFLGREPNPEAFLKEIGAQ
eukprot:TRINITY_DN232_c0_g2_i1.p1 TRINITY_DN232_c0_g2~~TRINITY_DN232_c0_g2_i1.p1  ORF type:complete len:572 (+),score=214.58 TRINITY_DN232_c0_g2_i1:230-1945(+)